MNTTRNEKQQGPWWTWTSNAGLTPDEIRNRRIAFTRAALAGRPLPQAGGR